MTLLSAVIDVERLGQKLTNFKSSCGFIVHVFYDVEKIVEYTKSTKQAKNACLFCLVLINGGTKGVYMVIWSLVGNAHV